MKRIYWIEWALIVAAVVLMLGALLLFNSSADPTADFIEGGSGGCSIYYRCG